MLLLVITTISVPAFADNDDRNERDDDVDERINQVVFDQIIMPVLGI
jgi:hypothetical protein